MKLACQLTDKTSSLVLWSERHCLLFVADLPGCEFLTNFRIFCVSRFRCHQLAFRHSCCIHHRYFWSPQPLTGHVSSYVTLHVFYWLQFLDTRKPSYCQNRLRCVGSLPIRCCIFAWGRTGTIHILSRSISSLYTFVRDVARDGNHLVF